MLLAQALLQRQLAKRRARPKLRPIYPPQGIEYQRALVRYARMCELVIREYLVEPLPGILAQSLAPTVEPSSATTSSESQLSARSDDIGTDIERALRTIRAILEAGGSQFMLAIAKMLDSVQANHARNFVQAYGAHIPGINPTIGAEPWLREQMAVAIQENVRLIKSIPGDLLDEVQSVINRGVLEGTQTAELGELIEARFGITERRARGIARDQTSKWHSSVNRLRCVDAGVEELEWSTSNDDRVRPTHRANQGKRFPIDKPPAATGHAGHDPNCRCCEIPVIPEYEAEGEGVDAELGFEEARAAKERHLAVGR
jgi:SPP1 gp7 family putative phage head morphogenesis protein